MTISERLDEEQEEIETQRGIWRIERELYYMRSQMIKANFAETSFSPKIDMPPPYVLWKNLNYRKKNVII